MTNNNNNDKIVEEVVLDNKILNSGDNERDEKSDLHCEREIDDYFDNPVVNDNNLPDVVIDIVNEYNDKITYFMRCV